MRFSILYVIFISVNGLLNVPKKSAPNKLKVRSRQWWLKSLHTSSCNKKKPMCILCNERPRKRLYCDECIINN